MGKLCPTASKKLMTRFSELRSKCLAQTNLGKALSGQHLKNTRLLTHCNAAVHQITIKLTHSFHIRRINGVSTSKCFLPKLGQPLRWPFFVAGFAKLIIKSH